MLTQTAQHDVKGLGKCKETWKLGGSVLGVKMMSLYLH